MDADIRKDIEALAGMTVGDLRARYLEAFGEETRSHNRDYLQRRIAWRLQAEAFGGLSERARKRAAELARDSDIRLRAPKGFLDLGSMETRLRTVHAQVESKGEDRLPPPGTLLVREYQGRRIMVQVLEHGFEYEDRIYGSLSAVAREATGTRWNGYLFFGLAGKPSRSEAVRKERRNGTRK